MSVEVIEVSRRFDGGAPALNNINLQIPDGEFAVLLGPSGSGKTTLLRILAGLEFPDSGAVRINDRDVAALPARQRGIGFVPQNYALFRHMTVFENVAFGLRIRPAATRPSRREIASRVEKLLDLVQIGALARRYPDQLSGGQRQRVALARALAIEPAVLLLDEPFSALDARVRKDLRGWLRELHERLGLTSILVTHDQDEAMEIADRVAVLERGSLVQYATPRQLLERPATPFVAGFLGEAAELPCEVHDGYAHFSNLPLPPTPTDCANGPARAFLRPGDLVASPGGGEWAVSHATMDSRGVRLSLQPGSGGETMDAVAAPTWRDAAVGDRCSLRLLAAAVFPRSA